MANQIYKTKNTIRRQVHLITVPNTILGKMKIAALRRGMKESNSSLRIVLYGRGHRHGKGNHHRDPKSPTGTGWRIDNDFQSNLPLKKASDIAVYLTARARGGA